jgi:class 3 adenylate cyclase
MRKRMEEVTAGWRRRGHVLGFGVGIALGYATLGQIGYEGRFDYAAIGTVTNLASRLCAEARAGQILITQRIYSAIEDLAQIEPIGELTLKGFSRPVPAFNVVEVKEVESKRE